MNNGREAGSHILREVAFDPQSRTPFRALCRCGWGTPAYVSAGLTHSVFESHLRCEAARELSAQAALVRLETMDQRHQSQVSRHRIAEVRSAILARLSIPGDPDEQRPSATTVVTITPDPGARRDLARAFSSQPRFRLLGEGDSGMDAVVMSSIQPPRILVIDDGTTEIHGLEAMDLVRCVAPDQRVCLYGESSGGSDQADLVVPKSVSPSNLVRLLLPWAA